MDGRPIDRGWALWLAAVIAGAAVSVTAMAFASLDPSSPDLWWDVSWTAAALAAVGGMIVARSRALPRQRERWTLWMLAAVSWLCGQLAWNLFSVIGVPRAPNAADICWWGFALLVIAGLIRARTSSGLVRLVALVEACRSSPR